MNKIISLNEEQVNRIVHFCKDELDYHINESGCADEYHGEILAEIELLHKLGEVSAAREFKRQYVSELRDIIKEEDDVEFKQELRVLKKEIGNVWRALVTSPKEIDVSFKGVYNNLASIRIGEENFSFSIPSPYVYEDVNFALVGLLYASGGPECAKVYKDNLLNVLDELEYMTSNTDVIDEIGSARNFIKKEWRELISKAKQKKNEAVDAVEEFYLDA